MDFICMNDGSSLTAEEKLQKEIAGDETQLIFFMFGTDAPCHKEIFKQGVTFI